MNRFRIECFSHAMRGCNDHSNEMKLNWAYIHFWYFNKSFARHKIQSDCKIKIKFIGINFTQSKTFVAIVIFFFVWYFITLDSLLSFFRFNFNHFIGGDTFISLKFHVKYKKFQRIHMQTEKYNVKVFRAIDFFFAQLFLLFQ